MDGVELALLLVAALGSYGLGRGWHLLLLPLSAPSKVKQVRCPHQAECGHQCDDVAYYVEDGEPPEPHEHFCWMCMKD